MDADLKNEISKGLKTFRVFEKLADFVDNVSSMDNEILERSVSIKKLQAQQNEWIEKNKQANDDYLEAQKKALSIVSEAEIKRDGILRDANNNAASIVAKAKNEAVSIEADIKNSSQILDNIKREISVENAALSELRANVAALKRELQKLLGA